MSKRPWLAFALPAGLLVLAVAAFAAGYFHEGAVRSASSFALAYYNCF